MPTARRPFDRSAMLDELRAASAPGGDPFDVVVIGGGITGAGVALDAAARGLRTAIVERDDFASGTSSKSSKMVHGGLRYLQNGDVRLVYEALRERRRLMRNAPHLVRLLPFMIPILSRDGVISKKVAKALGSAMWMYDLTGGWRIGRLHRRVGADEAAEHFPTTDREKLSGGYIYYDAGADDARLTLTIVRTAAERGAVAVNRCRVVDITRTDERADGVVVDVDGEILRVPTRCVVSAAGVWADEVRTLDEGTNPNSIRPAKGVHIAVPWELIGNDVAVIIPVRADKRSLFIVPWGPRPDGTYTHAYIGTTDTDEHGPLDDPQCDGDDIDYILTALDEALTSTITRDDITGMWAGLRPLVKEVSDEAPTKSADLSRRHRVAVSETGVVRVNGGKLTTYREMAEDTVDVVVRSLHAPRRARRSATRRLRLFGAPGGRSARRDEADHLSRRFGTAADEVRALVALDADLGRPLVVGQPYLRAEAVYAVRSEMATTLVDVLARRTRAHVFDRTAALESAPAVARLIADDLGWDDDEIHRQIDEYRKMCDAEAAAATRSRAGRVDTAARTSDSADDQPEERPHDHLANSTD